MCVKDGGLLDVRKTWLEIGKHLDDPFEVHRKREHFLLVIRGHASLDEVKRRHPFPLLRRSAEHFLAPFDVLTVVPFGWRGYLEKFREK